MVKQQRKEGGREEKLLGEEEELFKGDCAFWAG